MTRQTRWMVAGGLAGYFTLDGLLTFGYKYLEERIDDPTAAWLPSLVDEMTGAYAAALLVPIFFLLIRRFRLQRDNWLARLPAHLLGAIAYSVAHTSILALSRDPLYRLVGLGGYDYGDMALRVPMEFFNDVIWYAILVLVVHAFLYYRDTRDRELRTARLETELSEARLRSLKAQLNPHFLFNTLNTISSHMYRDVEAADRMMSRLSDLLRHTLEAPPDQEVSLDRELALLRPYIEIMRERLGERLQVRFDIAPDARAAAVPALLLQPLLENAIQHGIAPRQGLGSVRLRARRVGQRLTLEVRDDGPGRDRSSGDPVGRGIGLKATRSRLAELYGDAASLRLEDAEPRGTRAVVELPYREVGSDPSTDDTAATAPDPGGPDPERRSSPSPSRARG